jgi:hypothetical protein
MLVCARDHCSRNRVPAINVTRVRCAPTSSVESPRGIFACDDSDGHSRGRRRWHGGLHIVPGVSPRIIFASNSIVPRVHTSYVLFRTVVPFLYADRLQSSVALLGSHCRLQYLAKILHQQDRAVLALRSLSILYQSRVVRGLTWFFCIQFGVRFWCTGGCGPWLGLTDAYFVTRLHSFVRDR